MLGMCLLHYSFPRDIYRKTGYFNTFMPPTWELELKTNCWHIYSNADGLVRINKEIKLVTYPALGKTLTEDRISRPIFDI